MKIIADENIPLVQEFFADLGEITTFPGRKITADDVRDADALLVRSVTRVNQSLLEKSRVKFVGTCTIGVDHLDQEYLTATQRYFTNAPGCNANSVVEYVYAALCELNVDWLDKKIGIIGCGNVGGLLYRRLKTQKIDCYCYDPFKTSDEIPDLTSLETVLQCDIICMHTPLTTTGQFPSLHLIKSKELQQINSNTVLLNAGRGPVIHNVDLLKHLQKMPKQKVVLDVWEPEPKISLDLLDKVSLGSPHIAGYSFDGKLNGTEMIYQAFCRYFNFPATKKLADLNPPLTNNQLSPQANLSDWEQVRYLIKQVYKIANDDKNLREQARLARQESGDISEGFDNLRKHYYRRREFHNYQITLNSSQEKLAQRLKPLGFQIVFN